MKERVYNKLVRDNIPDIIAAGETPVIRTLEDGEFLRCLEGKLREEVEEFLRRKILNELGDILEVLEAMAHLQGWTDGRSAGPRRRRPSATGVPGAGVPGKSAGRGVIPWMRGTAPGKNWPGCEGRDGTRPPGQDHRHQIVERAGLTRQTFYRNFQDKYDLVNWHFEQLAQKSFKQMGVSLTLREALIRKFEFLKGEGTFFSQAFRSRDHNSVVAYDYQCILEFYTGILKRKLRVNSCPRTSPSCWRCTAVPPLKRRWSG